MNTCTVAAKKKSTAYRGLGPRIKTARENSGLTQVEFARRAGGVQPTQVSRWEREENVPRPDQLDEIAKLGKVSVQWLLTGIGAVPPPVAGARTEYEVSYPSLRAFLDELGDDITPAERTWLSSQRFAEGEPDPSFWPKQLLLYRKHHRPPQHLTAVIVADDDDYVPLRDGKSQVIKPGNPGPKKR